MKLEHQIVSLELANKLKELGVKQESLFYWYESNHSIVASDIGKLFWYVTYKDDTALRNEKRVSAFTVAELGEMLPDFYETYRNGNPDIGWSCREKAMSEIYTFGKTEADARAKMLIYLLENKLITL